MISKHKNMKILSCVIIGMVMLEVYCDVYMHNPRGSNNRLDERGRERANANRMFDSQNNNRGGYNVGSLYYYAGTELPIEWTNQHSCGEKNSHCELILQYMCDDQLRDGVVTRTIPERWSECDGYNCNSDLEYGMNENYDWYMNCKYRERNKGLFTADQKLKGSTAKYTRQNPNGQRRGYECPEERDYYPYWHPSPWKDIVIMTNDVTRCPMYQEESQNVKDKYSCVPPPGYMQYLIKGQGPNRKNLPITKDECEKIEYPLNSNKTAKWVKTKNWGLPHPDCLASPRSRDNHNGNGPGAFPNMFNWTIDNAPHEHCALRLRYNISTSDYDGWKINSSANAVGKNDAKVDIGSLVGLKADEAKKRGYVFKNNPVVNPLSFGKDNVIGKKLQLQLAINTAQYGRVFQDRSHSFAIRKRPKNLKGKKIHNLNVRGKRGNIVQVYPAVEYDFVPNRLQASVEDYVHFQWTGSNTNPNNNDGQGLAGTDRSNVVLLTPQQYPEGKPRTDVAGHWGNSYPTHLNMVNFLGLSRNDLTSLAVLVPGQLRGELSELDDAGTYFDLGPRKITSTGTYYYMCTRNNNFSNRSQKGKIVVQEGKQGERVLGWNGGAVMLSDDEGVWVKKGALQSSKSIRIEEWTTTSGENFIKSKGGSVSAGDDYKSNFVAVYPFGAITSNNDVIIKMKVTSEKGDIYHSTDYQNWDKVDDVQYDGGIASFQTSKGGVYVARASRDAKTKIIIGVVIGFIVLAILVIGSVVYFRKKPEAYRNVQKNVKELKLSTQSKI